MVATAEAAKLSGWHLGETVPFGDFTVEQMQLEVQSRHRQARAPVLGQARGTRRVLESGRQRRR